MIATTPNVAAIAEIATIAIAYAHHELPTFPLHAIRPDGRCGCSDPDCNDAGKHPAAMGWQRSIASEAAAASIWPVDARRLRGIGLATGPRAGLWVLDVDPRHGGDESLAKLVSEHGPLPATWEAITGRLDNPGRHLFWAWPEGGPAVRNSTGAISPGLDVRGQGGYVVLPPSPHASGGRYRWHRGPDTGRPAPAPPWLLERARAARRALAAPAVSTTAGREVLVGSGRRRGELLSLLGLMRWWGAGERTLVAATLAFLDSQCLDDDPANPIVVSKAVRDARDIARRYKPGRSW